MKADPVDATRVAPVDHDDFGMNQSKIMNVIDSNNSERDAGGKPVPTFPHPALADILGRVGLELDDLAKQLKHVQVSISPLVRLVPAHEHGVMRDIQELDHIEQKVHCLSQFLSALGPMMQGHWVLDTNEASKVVTLSELAQRLRCADGDVAEDHPGEFELF